MKKKQSWLMRLLLNTLALAITAWLIPGIKVDGFVAALLAALLLGVVNTIIRPVVLLLTLPATIMTLGLFTLLINGVMLLIVEMFVPGFHVQGFWWAVLGSLAISLISTVLSALVGDKEDKKK